MDFFEYKRRNIIWHYWSRIDMCYTIICTKDIQMFKVHTLLLRKSEKMFYIVLYCYDNEFCGIFDMFIKYNF